LRRGHGSKTAGYLPLKQCSPAVATTSVPAPEARPGGRHPLNPIHIRPGTGGLKPETGDVMARDPLAAVGLTATPQTQRILGRTDQVRNNAGGYVFAKDLMTKVEDFLILGTAGGTYYISEDRLTMDNAGWLIQAIQSDGAGVVRLITEVSTARPPRAPKNRAAVFALAMVFPRARLQPGPLADHHSRRDRHRHARHRIPSRRDLPRSHRNPPPSSRERHRHPPGQCTHRRGHQKGQDLVLDVLTVNHRAQALYQRLGVQFISRLLTTW
jgi:hypothetical protein